MKIKNYLVALLTLPTIILTSCNYDNVPESNIIKQEQTGSLNLKINLPEYNSQKEFNTKAESTSFIKGLNLLVENKSFGGTYSQEKNIIPQSTNENVSFSGIPEGQVKVFIEAVGQNNTFLGSNIKENEQGKVITVKANQTNNADLELEVINPNIQSDEVNLIHKIPIVPDGKIIVDGNGDDWAGINPASLDPKGDSIGEVDLKNIYLAKDSTFLYWRIDNWTSAINTPEVSNNGYSVIISTSKNLMKTNGDIETRVFSNKRDFMLEKIINNQRIRLNNSQISGMFNTICEMKIPLGDLGNLNNKIVTPFYYKSIDEITPFEIVDFD